MLDFATQYPKIGVTNNQSFAYHFVGNFVLYRKPTWVALSRHGFWTRKRVFRSLRIKGFLTFPQILTIYKLLSPNM